MVQFPGYPFHTLRLNDNDMLQEYLRRYPQHVSGYTFATLAAYAPTYGIHRSRVGPECLLLARRLDDKNLHLLQPIGKPTDPCCDGLLEAAAALSYPLQMVYVTKDYIEKNPRFSAHFSAEEDRASANYLYVARDLAELAGGRYAKKRNLIAHDDRRKSPVTGRVAAPGLVFLQHQCSSTGAPIAASGISITGPDQAVILVASVPLTDEPWQNLAEGDVIAIRAGRIGGRRAATRAGE